MAWVSTKIEVELEKLDLCPLGGVQHTAVLHDLASSFQACYNREGNISDLDRAIEIKQTVIDLCPLGSPEHVGAVAVLAASLLFCYDV